MKPILRLCLLLALTALLGACQDGKISVALSADAPATPLQKAVVTLTGVTFKRDDNSLDNINLKNSVQVDLMRYDTVAFNLISGQTLKAGQYNFIQLHFSDDINNDKDNFIVDNSGVTHPLTITNTGSGPSTDSDFLPINLKIKKTGKSYAVQMRLDLRLSLADEGGDHVLVPVLRASRDTQAASVTGSVSDSTVRSGSCRGSGLAGAGVAVYAFSGSNVTPHDKNGTASDPVASAPVLATSSSTWAYNLRVLPAGDYTLALTCNGNIEDAEATDNLVFFNNPPNVTLGDGDNKTINFN